MNEDKKLELPFEDDVDQLSSRFINYWNQKDSWVKEGLKKPNKRVEGERTPRSPHKKLQNDLWSSPWKLGNNRKMKTSSSMRSFFENDGAKKLFKIENSNNEKTEADAYNWGISTKTTIHSVSKTQTSSQNYNRLINKATKASFGKLKINELLI